MQHYLVIYSRPAAAEDFPQRFVCQADDHAHAHEQCLNAYPGAVIHSTATSAGETPSTLPPYDAYELAPVYESRRTQDVELCITFDDARALAEDGDGKAYWSLYGHLPEGGVECIGDFDDYACAASIYSRITGLAAPDNPEGCHLVALPAVSAAPATRENPARLVDHDQRRLRDFVESIAALSADDAQEAKAVLARLVQDARDYAADLGPLIRPHVLVSVQGGVAECVAGEAYCAIRDLDNGDEAFTPQQIADANALTDEDMSAAALLVHAYAYGCARDGRSIQWEALDEAHEKARHELGAQRCADIDALYAEED